MNLLAREWRRPIDSLIYPDRVRIVFDEDRRPVLQMRDTSGAWMSILGVSNLEVNQKIGKDGVTDVTAKIKI